MNLLNQCNSKTHDGNKFKFVSNFYMPIILACTIAIYVLVGLSFDTLPVVLPHVSNYI